MAEVVLGIGMSHSPMLTCPSSEWHNRALADRQNPNLTLADGQSLSYAQLVELRGEPYADSTTTEAFAAADQRCQLALDRLAVEIAEVEPEIVVIVGDDQDEFYSSGNMPAFAVFWGDEVVTHSYDDEMPAWFKPVAEGYAMDYSHTFPGHSDFALELITGLIDRDVDVAICNKVTDPKSSGFGHAFGYPVKRLFGGREIPIVPIMLNTYYPPNVMSAARSLHIGRALRETIEASASTARVAVLASGGLSHFVVEEDLDRLVLRCIADGNLDELARIPRAALKEGSSEILNWIMTAGASSHLPVKWTEYEPIRRTPAGTGVGVGFAVWRDG